MIDVGKIAVEDGETRVENGDECNDCIEEYIMKDDEYGFE